MSGCLRNCRPDNPVYANESSKYWLNIINELKNRGVKDILVLCADGLTGINEAIFVAYPQTEYQRCIVHQVRNTLKYVADKDKKAFAADLKRIYQAPSEEAGYAQMKEVAEKWQEHYLNAMKSWSANWDAFHYIITKGMKSRIWISCPIENYHGKPIYRKSFTQPREAVVRPPS